MSTQTTIVNLYGSRGAEFTATSTDDVYNNQQDANSLDLDDVLLGATITGYSGQYAGGGAVCRIRNSVTNKVKAMGCLDIATEEVYHEFDRPVRIEVNDRIEVLCVAAPT